jgi:hypothetical protein
MRRALILALLLCSIPAFGTSYFISPSGSDGNNGLSSGAAWLSPNHALNCGDTISAAAGTYSSANFQTGHWGTVTCAGNNNAAWLICATFDACKLSSTSSDALWVDKSYWAIVGWEATTSTNIFAACFHAGPNSNTNIHHIIFADNVANGCMGGGFTAYDHSTTGSVDYIVYIGNIAYNAAQGTGACYSGLNIYQPIQSDGNSGTHMYVAGNFSYHNIDGSSCDSAGAGKTTDGEGINFDTWDFSQGGGTAYVQQGVIQNNIEGWNGTRGIEVENNSAGGTHAPIFIKFNTAIGSGVDPNMAFPAGIAEIGIIGALNVNVQNNLVYTVHQFTTGSNNFYALGMTNGNGTDTVDNNYAAGISGNNTYLQTSTGFSYGAGNVLGTNPSFPSTTVPSAPSCSGQTNTATCMSTVISNAVPTVTAAKAYGYQTVSNTSITDTLFPAWLCTATGVMNANIPAGLVTPGCGVASGSVTSGMHCQSGSPTGGLPGPGGTPPTQGLPCG